MNYVRSNVVHVVLLLYILSFACLWHADSSYLGKRQSRAENLQNFSNTLLRVFIFIETEAPSK